MAKFARKFSVCIPGLYSHLSVWEQDFAFQLPAGVLKDIFTQTRLKKVPCSGLENTLLYLAGFSMQSLPSWAVLRYQQDIAGLSEASVSSVSEFSEKAVLCADPVTLQNAHDGIYLASESPTLTASEAHILCQSLNKHLAQDGWFLQCMHPQRWYLHALPTHSPENLPPWPQTTAPDLLATQNIAAHLPVSQPGQPGYWEQLLTELQMLLHQHPLNAQREQAREPLVNSVWLWGDGSVPVAPDSAVLDQVVTNDHCHSGKVLAHFLDCPYHEAPSFVSMSSMPSPETTGIGQEQQQHTLIILKDLSLPALQVDPPQWQQQLHKLEQDWLLPLKQNQQKNKSQVTLYDTAGQCWQSRQRVRWRFWPVH